MVLHVWKKFPSLISILIFAKDYQHIIKRVGFENVNKMITIIKKISKLVIPLRQCMEISLENFFMLLLRLNPLTPSIQIQILQTDLHTFPVRNC